MRSKEGVLLINSLKIGTSESYQQTITDSDIKMFAGLSGDKNLIHMSDEFAENSRFKKRIAPGLLSASFFSALLGTKLPGYGCVYVSQSLNFRKPVYLGDTVKATIEITSIDKRRSQVCFKTICKVKRKTVIDGEAIVFIP